jgi:hypothetical protein
MFCSVKKVGLLLVILLLVKCAPSQPPLQSQRPVQGLIKQFPDNSRYFIIYTLPDFFPQDIPVYPGGVMQKGFVYQERDMDLIFKTSDSIEDIIRFFETKSGELRWSIERNMPDPAANHQTFTLALTFKDSFVETFRYLAARGHIFAAQHTGIYLVIRIVESTNSPFTFIIQQIRTGS